MIPMIWPSAFLKCSSQENIFWSWLWLWMFTGLDFREQWFTICVLVFLLCDRVIHLPKIQFELRIFFMLPIFFYKEFYKKKEPVHTVNTNFLLQNKRQSHNCNARRRRRKISKYSFVNRQWQLLCYEGKYAFNFLQLG